MMWDRDEKARHRRQLAAVEEQKAAQARQLLDNPAMTDAFAKLDAMLVQAWRDARTTADREEIWFRLQGLTALQSEIGAAASGGAVAAYNTRSLAE
jgi:hypothetical protein